MKRIAYVKELGWLLVGGLSTFAFCWGVIGFKHELPADYTESIKKHTEIINSIGVSARTSSEVSDLLMRVSHYTDNHGDTKNVFCPECSKDEPQIAERFFIANDEHTDEPEDVPATLGQAMRDLHEIDNGVKAIDFGHRHQIIHLRNLLKQLQEPLNSSIIFAK